MFDERQFPLVVMRCRESLDDAFLTELEADLIRVLARDERYTLIVDLRPIQQFPDARFRRDLARLLQRPVLRERHQRLQVGSANIVENDLIRAALTGLIWMWAPAIPMASLPTFAEAVRWSAKRLVEVGVQLPHSVAEFAREAEMRT